LPALGVAVVAGALVFAVGARDETVLGVAAIAGVVLGAVAALTGLAASYLVVDWADLGVAEDVGRFARWHGPAVAVVQALLPVAACCPVVLALQTAL
jgi:hypothetical protein